jgi:hypothetical protein
MKNLGGFEKLFPVELKEEMLESEDQAQVEAYHRMEENAEVYE